MIQDPQLESLRAAVDRLAGQVAALAPEPAGFVDEHFGSMLGAAVALIAVVVAWWQSSQWKHEFRYQRDHDSAKQVNAAVTEWIGRVRWTRRPVRSEPAEVVRDDPHAGLRSEMQWCGEAANAAEKALTEAAVLWGHDNEQLRSARVAMHQVMFDLRFAFEILTWERSPPLAPEEVEQLRQARVTLFAKGYRIDKGEDPIENNLREIHEAIEKVTRPILNPAPWWNRPASWLRLRR